MISLILFLAIGLGLLIGVFALARRSPAAEGGAQAIIEAQQSLQTLEHGLLPSELVARIFAKEDRDFVSASAPADVQAQFLELRKRIALNWVAQVRRHILCLKAFHFGRSRNYAHLNPASEMGLAIKLASVLIECRALQLMILLSSPYSASRLLSRTAASADGLCAVTRQALSFLSPAYLEQYGRDSTRSEATR